MKTTTGIMGLVCWVIFVFCGSVLAGEAVALSPENGVEQAVGEVENMGVPVAPLGYEGISNTLYGTGAGNSLGDDDDFATFIGYQAGYNSGEGKYNTFMGFRAGYSNTTGYENTFLGVSAGYSNTTGYENTFLGASAGLASTTGASNTFLGRQAGYSNTTGYENTFLGDGAGHSNTTAYENTFLGYQAGYFSTTGPWNTFLGGKAGYSNTTGYANIFLGQNTGYANTTGYHNTFLGIYAGISNTTGTYNTFLGSNAGNNNTTGNSNTFLGRSAGYLNTTGSGNVFLGDRAGYNETGSNKLYLDNSDTNTPLIYGEFDNNRLTINGTLEVIGPDNGLVKLSNVVTNNTTKASRMVLRHYSNAELPVYLFGAASTPLDNFVAFGGGATIGNAATQLDLFTAPTATTPVGTPRLTIIGNGYVGIGTQTPASPLQMAGGAYTDGASWINASSREYKENIESLDSREAIMTLVSLEPVKFNYKSEASEKHVGFIAEDVPELVATKDRKGLSPMDIVAVLTKVVKEQQETVQKQQAVINTLMEKLAQLEAKMEDLQPSGIALSILSEK